jgi:2-deoxy-D-gluconate 3-dehydrogenase
LLSFQGGINVPGYAASKGAVASLLKAFANEWAPHGITVNGVAPGGIERNQDQEFIKRYNQIVPLERMATETEISKVVLWMASDSASYITGQILPVDGGWTAK